MSKQRKKAQENKFTLSKNTRHKEMERKKDKNENKERYIEGNNSYDIFRAAEIYKKRKEIFNFSRHPRKIGKARLKKGILNW